MPKIIVGGQRDNHTILGEDDGLLESLAAGIGAIYCPGTRPRTSIRLFFVGLMLHRKVDRMDQNRLALIPN